VKIGEPAVVPLIALLTDLDPEVRHDAACALGSIGEPAIGPLVEESRKAGNEQLRRTIAKILEGIDEEAKEKQHEFGVRETTPIRAPRIPEEFKNAMLDKTVKVRV